MNRHEGAGRESGPRPSLLCRCARERATPCEHCGACDRLGESMSTQAHWETSYRTKPADQRSWSTDADTSLRLITRHVPASSAGVVDVGGGASPLAQRLVTHGYSDVTVVDVSQTAIDEAIAGAGAMSADLVTWVCADVRSWQPGRTFDVWHDRAVLHFLIASQDRDAYAKLVTQSLNPLGILILASFAEDGPESCSGLPVMRATHDQLSELFGGHFDRLEVFREVHHTPWGSEQPFNWLVMRRRTSNR